MTLDQEMQAGHAAQRYADAHQHLLADHCGIVDDPAAAAITRRERILAQNQMPVWVRRSLERRNSDAEQKMIVRGCAKADSDTAADLGAWLVKGVCLFGSIAMAWHLIATNWGL